MAKERPLSVPEAAELTGRTNQTIRRWIKEEGLEAERVYGRSGSEWRIDQDDLLEFIKVELR